MFVKKHDIQYMLYYFHSTLQWFCSTNTVTTSWTEQRLYPWERIHIRKLAGKHVFKNLNDFYTSVLNSKNMNNSKIFYETVQINFQLDGNRWFETTFTGVAEVHPGHLRWGSETHLRHCRSASPSKTLKTNSSAKHFRRREEKERRSFCKWK